MTCTLVLAKPSDIPLILLKVHSFDPQIQFTHEIFTNNNDVHFLDIKITPTATAVYLKSTHSGNTSIYLALHHGVGKLMGYMPLYIVPI